MQATRGAPLNQPAGDSAPAGPPSRVGLVVGLAVVLVIVDQVAKAVAVAQLTDRAPVELLNGLVTLRLIRNPGAAFGLAAGFTIVLTALAVVVCVVLVRLARRLTSLPWAIALGLLLGGALGNLIDRIFRPPGTFEGHVIDFIDTPVTLVFNVADAAITFAGAFMVLLALRSVPLVEGRADDAGA
jgi:signal peptidase II